MSDALTDPDRIPEWAGEWMAQWRSAAIRLEEFRDWELRNLSNSVAAGSSFDPNAPLGEDRQAWSGLVVLQRWLIRQRLLELDGIRGNASLDS